MSGEVDWRPCPECGSEDRTKVHWSPAAQLAETVGFDRPESASWCRRRFAETAVFDCEVCGAHGQRVISSAIDGI